jgi:hypothetical protein
VPFLLRGAHQIVLPYFDVDATCMRCSGSLVGSFTPVALLPDKPHSDPASDPRAFPVGRGAKTAKGRDGAHSAKAIKRDALEEDQTISDFLLACYHTRKKS